MSKTTKALKLVQDWNGFRRGTILPTVPDSSAKLLIERGVARAANENEAKDLTNATLCESLPELEKTDDNNPKVDNDKPTSKRTTKSKRSKKTPRDS